MRRGGPPKAEKVVDTKAIVGRIRISYPALRAARVDGGLRQLLMAELIAQTHSEGGSLVVPQGLRVQPVAPEQYRKYKEALPGLTEANAHLVQAKLIEMGLQPNAGEVMTPPADQHMRDAADPELKRLRETAV